MSDDDEMGQRAKFTQEEKNLLRGSKYFSIGKEKDNLRTVYLALNLL